MYGTKYKVQQAIHLRAALTQYADAHAGIYPTTGKRGIVDVMEALVTNPRVQANQQTASSTQMGIAFSWFVTYDDEGGAFAEFNKNGAISPDKIAFTYMDGLTRSDRGILMFYNQPTMAKPGGMGAQAKDVPLVKGRLVWDTSADLPEFIPEEQFQTEIAATRKLLEERRQAAVAAPLPAAR